MIKARPVLAYNEETGFSRIYGSVRQATSELGWGVQHVLAGKLDDINGWKFKYVEDATEDEKIVAVITPKASRAVEIYSGLYNLPVRRFINIEQARRYLEAHFWVEVAASNITSCANGRRKTAGSVRANGVKYKLRWRWVPLEITETMTPEEYDYAPANYTLGDYKTSTTRPAMAKPWKM